MTLIEHVLAEIEKARHEGAMAMLESVRASFRDYPFGGGDIEIMKEVDRIVRDAMEKGAQRQRFASAKEHPGPPAKETERHCSERFEIRSGVVVTCARPGGHAGPHKHGW